MFITHALKSKNLKQGNIAKKSLSKVDTNPIIVNKRLIVDNYLQNKQNYNPNIKQVKEQSNNHKSKDNFPKQSPLKKILFIKNLCHKSGKLNKQKNKIKESKKKICQQKQKLDSSSKKKLNQDYQYNQQHSYNQKFGNYQERKSKKDQNKERKKFKSSSSQNLLNHNFLNELSQNRTCLSKNVEKKLGSSRKQINQSNKSNLTDSKMLSRQLKKNRHSLNDIQEIKLQKFDFQKLKSNSKGFQNNSKKKRSYQVSSSLPQKMQSQQFINRLSQYASQERHYLKVCFNHPNKQARFKLDMEEEFNSYYCSKCAVNLVTQGMHIIQNLSSKSNRTEVIKNFLFQIDKLEPSVTQFLKQTNLIKKCIHEQYMQSSQKITLYYQNILKTIIKFSQQSQIVIKIHYQTFNEQIQKIQKNLLNYYNDLCYIRADITPNIQQITNQQTLNDLNFSQIINEHFLKLQTIKMKQTSLKQDQINYHIPILDQQIMQTRKNQIQKLKLEFKKKTINFMNGKVSQNNEEITLNKMKYSFGQQGDIYLRKKNQGNQEKPLNKNKKTLEFNKNENLIRLSFGKQKHQTLSPSFKII